MVVRVGELGLSATRKDRTEIKSGFGGTDSNVRLTSCTNSAYRAAASPSFVSLPFVTFSLELRADNRTMDSDKAIGDQAGTWTRRAHFGIFVHH